MRVKVMLFGAVACGAVLVPSVAGADGGRGASFCSESGPPSGVFAGDIEDFETFGNGDEVFSWFARRGAPLDRPGHIVRVVCAPVTP